MDLEQNATDRAPGPRGKRAVWTVSLLLAILALAAIVRFWGLTERELWFDENCTFYVVHHLLDWPTDGPGISQVAHWPYFAFLCGWTRLAGETLDGMRTFSALCGVLGVFAIWLVARRLGGRSLAHSVGLLAALSPISVYYGREARCYAFWLFVVAITIYFLCRAARTGRIRWWILYGCSALFAVLTHYSFLVWLPGTAAAVLIGRSARQFWRKWSITHVVLGLALMPVVWWLVMPVAAGGPKPWFREIWAAYPPALAVPRSIWSMLPSGGYPDYLGALSKASPGLSWHTAPIVGHLILWVPATVLVVLAGIYVWSCGRSSPPTGVPTVHEIGTTSESLRDLDRTLAFLLILSLANLLGAFLYSALWEPAYVVGRYDLASWPSLILCVGLLIERVSQSIPRSAKGTAVMRLVLVGVMCGCSAAVVGGMRLVPVDNSATRRAEQIVARVGPGDLVVSLNKYNQFVLYPWYRLGFKAEVISFPPQHDRQLCWYDAEAELADPGAIVQGVEEVARRIEIARENGRSVWLLAHGQPVGARWEVDRHFYKRVVEMGFDIQPVNDELGLAKLVPLEADSRARE